jgi:hypothetical protein
MTAALAVVLVLLAQVPTPNAAVVATVDRVDAAVLEEPLSYLVARGRLTSREVVVVTFTSTDLTAFLIANASYPTLILGDAACLMLVVPRFRDGRGRGVCVAPRPSVNQATLWMASRGFDLGTATEASLREERSKMTATAGRSVDVVTPDATSPKRFGGLGLLRQAYKETTK